MFPEWLILAVYLLLWQMKIFGTFVLPEICIWSLKRMHVKVLSEVQRPLEPLEWFTDQLLTASSVKGHDAHMSGCRKKGRGQMQSCQIALYSGQWVESQQTQGRKTAGHLPSRSSEVINGKELLIPVWFDIGWLNIGEMLKTQDKEQCRILLSACTYWELNVSRFALPKSNQTGWMWF